MKNMVIIIIFTIISFKLYAASIEIAGDDIFHHDIFTKTIIDPDNGDPIEYNIFNFFDNNQKTAVVINAKFRQNDDIFKYPFFRISLKKQYNIDKLVFYNGFQINDDLYNKNSRVKEIQITFFLENKIFVNEGEIYNDVIIDEKGRKQKIVIEWTNIITTNCILLDTKGKQIIEFPEVNANNLKIDVLTYYSGTQYDDICISKLEFWYRGEKYQVTNLKEAKKEYVKLYIAHVLNSLEPGVFLHDMEENNYNRLIKIAGWKYEQSESRQVGIFFEKSGEIKIHRFLLSSVKDRDLFPTKIIGKWKFDNEGRLFIMIGNGQFKLSQGKSIFTSSSTEKGPYFVGTDLEFEGIMEPSRP